MHELYPDRYEIEITSIKKPRQAGATKNNSGLTPVASQGYKSITFKKAIVKVTDYLLKKQLNQESGVRIVPIFVTDYNREK